MPGPPLTSERWRRTEEILLAAWSVPPEKRDVLLTERCRGDADLLAEVRELVAAQTAADTWVAAPPAEDSGPQAPRRVGPFELERLIGRGGMGAVYLAHRADGHFEQKVAVKLVGLPFETEAFRERFRRERQILAGLNHPNITRLLDGGVTAGGDLYLVMEYVAGVTIDRYCAVPGRTIPERLGLFRQVCSAVQFAHQNLIVHRDIKPSNILVTEDGTAKLLDFGTAGIISEADTTLAGVALMTPSYASPEQLRGEAVTTLSDVFSLGVVLREILTSEKLAPGGTPVALGGTPVALGGTPVALGGDPGQIVNKAMAPEPAGRYSSVERFSEDIRRYLAGEPVLAHPPGAFYRSAKFVRRHRVAVAGVAAMLVALAAAMLVTLQAQRRAERRFSQVRQLANYLVFDIHSGLQRLPGSTALEKQVVEHSLRYLDSLAAESSGDRTLRLELASAYRQLGDVLGNPFVPSLGDRKAALGIYEKALTLAASVVARDPRDPHARQTLAAIRLQHGGTEFFGGKRDAGQAEVRQAVEELKSVLAESPGDLDTRLSLARGLTFLAGRMQDGGGFNSAANAVEIEKVYAQAAAHLALALERQPGNVPTLRQMAQNEIGLGLLWGSDDPAKSIVHNRQAIQDLDRIAPDAQDDVELRRMRANALKNIGWAQGQMRQYADALANTDRAAAIFQALAAVDPANTSALYQLSAVYRNRGIVRGYNRDARGAIADFGRAAEIHRQLSERDPGNSNYRVLRGELLVRIGTLLHSLGKESDAVVNTAAGLEIMKQLAAAPNASPGQIMAPCGWLVETAVVSLRDAGAAMPYCLHAVEITQGKDAEAWIRLAAAQNLLGAHREAIATLAKAISMIPPAEPGKPRTRQRQTLEDSLALWRRALRR